MLAAGIPAQGKRELSGRAEQWGRTAAREYQRLTPRYSDYATTNAQQLMDLLSSANVPVVPPQG